MAKIVIQNEGLAPPSEGSGKTVVYTKSDGIYLVLEDGTPLGPVGPNTGSAGGDLTGTYPNPSIATGAVTSAKLANGSVLSGKLDTDAVTTIKIKDGNVTLPKLNIAVQNIIPSANEKAALVGTSGTPGSGNKYVTDSDPRLAGGGGSGITALTGDVTATGPGSVAATINPAISANFPSSGEKAALAGTSGTPGSGNKYVTNSDSRMTDSRSPSGSAGGSLSGTYPNPGIAAGAVTSIELATSVTNLLPTSNEKAALAGTSAPSGTNPYAVVVGTPASGDQLTWSGTAWVPSSRFSLIALDASMSGASPALIGSVYLEAGTVIRSTSRAMIGGLLPGEKAVLQFKRFTGGTLAFQFVATSGTLQDAALSPLTNVVLLSSDWYDLYLSESGGGSAVAKGVRLNFG